jgi:hypothetical protein
MMRLSFCGGVSKLLFSVGVFCCLSALAEDVDLIDAPSVEGFHVETMSNNVVLSWPSDPQESFVVLWRSNANYKTQWLILTNQMRAVSNSDQTVFIDANGLNRFRGEAKTNLMNLYGVHVIPDFWFDTRGITVDGRPGGDFFPFYYGSGESIFKPQVQFLVDGNGLYDVVEDFERINFGTPKNPKWFCVSGILFRHNDLPKGKHRLQLVSILTLNNLVGPWTQDLMLSNTPVQIQVSSKTNDESWLGQRLGGGCNSTSANEIPTRPLLLKEASQPKAKFQLDLGEVSHYVKVTPEYSNAVLKAVLPLCSEASDKLNLSVPKPITQSDIAKFQVQPFRELTAFVLLNDDWIFEYSFGHLRRIQNLRGYASLQDPDLIPHYYGEVKMTKDEAVQMARDTLTKLGISLEDVFAEQEPRVTSPVLIGTNVVPHYQIEWLDPRADNVSSVDIHINANTKQIERIYTSSKFLGHPLPIDISPIPAPDWPSVNPDYAWKLIPMMFQAIDKYAQKLSLPIPRPLTTNDVAKVTITDNEGWPHCEITLTNGWRFIYRHTMVNGYYASDNFFNSDNRKIHIKDFDGKWNLTTNQAIEIVRQALKKLDYPTNSIHIADAKTFIHGASVDREHIPRLSFEWYYETNDDLQSRLEAEVNMDNGKLESLYYDDKAYWNSRPPIDVPISVKE